ncbi:MAG TPA: PxKF domain-containing protein [Gaiellaceae bacterium]|nr:PxKF domain-containing protein [Gaiellaceae bacterium]
MADRPRGSAYVRMIVVLAAIAAAFAWVTPALAAGGSITASRSDSTALKRPFNLTTEGPIDWAVWGYSNGGTSTSLAPDVRKAGGSAISNLENISPALPTVPLRGLGQFPDVDAFNFSWSNGSGPLRDSHAATGIQHDGQQTGSSTSGDGFGFTVPAGLQPRTLKVYVATNRAVGTLTAHLSDGSAPDYVDSLPAAVDQNTAVYTITYVAGSAAQTLHVTWVESSDTCGSPFHCDNAGIYAVALTRNFVVNNAGAPVDAGCTVSDCTLPEAIADANADAGGSISFNLGAPPATINLASALTITKPVSIDGYTQSGAEPNASAFSAGNHATILVRVVGDGLFDSEGLIFGSGSDGSSVRGVAISGFSNAIHVQGASDVTIAGDFIGTPGSFPSNGTGVFVDGGAGSTVGGPESVDQNVISNNGASIGTGIDLKSTNGALIQGNYVGTDATGNVALGNDDGIAIFGGATNNVVSGNVISGNLNDGVTLFDAGTAGNSVVLNLIGVGADGSTPLHNSTGVSITPGSNGNGNAIGGPLGGNTIANNSGDGVDVDGAGSHTVVQANTITGNQNHGIVVGDELGGAPGAAIVGNRIAGNGHTGFDGFGIYVSGGPGPVTITGNTIGLDASGAAAQPNTSDGIRIVGASNVAIGGPGTGDRNVVSGNTGHGIHVMGGSTGDTIQGNYLGTNTAGTAAVPNNIDGIALDASSQNKVLGNLASGNHNQGISIFRLLNTDPIGGGNVVSGNTVGLNAAATGAVPNGGVGILMSNVNGNVVGGIGAGQANQVADNGGAGVAVVNGPGAATGNSIRGNSVHDNGGLGIDLGNNGVTANDPGDADTGPNNLQNFPTLTGASINGSSTEITGTLSTATGHYVVDFYDSPACDPSGNGEGARWIGWGDVNAVNNAGSIDTGSGITAPVSAGDAITATATDDAGNTSELSGCVTATGPAPKVGLALTSDEASVPAGAANVPLSSVPAAVLGQFAFAPVPNSPVPNSAVGAAPVPNSPVPNSPVPNSPVPNSPVPNSPVANSGFDGISPPDLSKILLSSIPIDWSTIFAGTNFENVPVTGLTLKNVYDTPTALQRFEQLTIGQLQLQNSLLRGVRLESILFGGTKLQFIPPYTQSAWCAQLTSCVGVDVGRTTVLGLDVAGLLNDTILGNLGKVTVGQITDPVAPVPNSPVPNSPVPNSPVPNSPVPNSALTLTAIGGVVIGNLFDPNLVVDCSKFSSTAVCLTKTLADAAALGAIKSTATFAEILAPKTAGGPSPLANTNFNEFAIALVGLDNLPWESWPIDGFQSFAGTGDVVHYHLTAPVPCGSAYSLRVTLPRGFLVKPGTSSIVVGTGARQTAGDPAQDAALGATWSTSGQGLPQATGCTGTQPAGLDFQALAGFRIGQQTATANLIVGTTTNTAVNQAPVTVSQNNEPDNSPATAPSIQPNALAVGHIASSSDVDWRSFSTANLPAGTKIIVYLRPPSGTDLDLYLTKPGSLSLLSSPVPNSPVPNSPVPNSPVPNSPVPNSGDTLNLTNDNPPPEGLQDAPVPNSAIASEGITRGDETEVAAITLTGDETGNAMGILVDGYNGDHSNDPYTLRVQVVRPATLPACPPRTFVNPSATVGTLPASINANTQTLFLVNQEAMGRTYGQTAADGLMARLNTFVSAHPDLNAAVLPVDGDAAVHAAKAAWDASPCSIPAANDVVRKINALVAHYRQTATGVQNLVIVGGDEQIPMARVADGTTDANESSASGDLLFTTQGGTRANALYASEFLGNVVTDDAYAAGAIIPWFGGELDLPSMAVGRLVETPADIQKQLDAYDASGGVLDPGSGVLNPQTGLVTGYDFMTDEAQQLQTELSRRLSTPGPFDLLNNGLWDQAAIAPYLNNTLGRGGILSVNAHYNHWELAPASPQPIVKSGLVDSSVLPGIATNSQLRNAILFTMGCHAGLSVSDTFPAATAKQQQLRDWAQAFAQNGAGVFVANTGYGYGDYKAIALSEQLMTMFAHNLASDGTIGRKLMLAKQKYFGTIGTADPYAAKALQEATFYGLPFYAIGSRTEAADAPPVSTSPTGVPGVNSAPFTWPSSFNTSLVQHTTDRGTFWSTSENGVEYIDGRPIEPRADHEVTTSGGPTAHGVLITSLTTHDTAVDPLIASPMIDNSANEQELKVANATFPAAFASVGHWTAFGKNHDELVFVPGQTRDGSVQRLVDNAGLQVLYSSSSDVTPPLFTQVGSVVNGSTATIFAKVSDETTAAPLPLVRAFFTQGGTTWTFVDLSYDAASGLYTGTATGITVPRIEAAFEAEDGAGNVAYTTDKGHLFLSLTGDHTGPEITVAAPISNGAIGLSQALPASFACSDDGGVASCTATNDGSPITNGANVKSAPYGPHTLVVTAKDLSGNTSTATVSYTVGYRFSGFFQPIDNPPILNVAKAGSAVPVIFSLGGNQGLGILAAGSPSTTQIGCDNAAPTDNVPDNPTDTAGKSGLNYDAKSGQYTYVWKTEKTWTGTCRRLNVTLADGTVHVANFKFK